MRKKSTILFVLFLTFISGFSQNAFTFWTDLAPQSYELTGSYRGIPVHYRAMSLKERELKNYLAQVPLEGSGQWSKEAFLVPYPDGRSKKFRIVESPVMEAGLAQKFPEIKTYLGKGIDDPYATMRLSITLQGVHAIIHQVEGTLFIDPYPAVNQQVYFSYYKKDYRAAKSFAEYALPQDPGSGHSGPVMPLGSGQTLHTYRIAIATTGEYASFHGGSTGSVMSAIVTTLNRVNSVYEKELAIRLILVNSNDRIIYLDGNTDPFTNTDPNSLISENQTTIDAEIGSANYDIGHVFSTGGGGLASSGVVCLSGYKANGVTGSSSPIGDPFDIDYVTHEIGHQFNAAHTFNSRRGGCQGNRESYSAFEPGSGSTVMGYAGLCGLDNLQVNSHDYFHTGSYSQIRNYIILDTGNTCGTSVATGNTPPTVRIKLGNTRIPMMTPFELEGEGDDVDGDSLTFCWEQYDLGPSGSPNAPAGDAPIFRSFSPTVSPVRVFPKLESILNNTSTLGEILPTYGRNLNFRLTVRDNRAGGGGVEWDSTQFIVTNQAGPFEMIFPNTSTTIWIRTTSVKIPIRWNPANTQFSPVNCDSVQILLSVDGGYTFPFTLAQSVANSGLANVSFPYINTDSARIKVKARENVFFTLSKENFAIKLENVGLDIIESGLSLKIGPNPAEELLYFHLQSLESTQIKLELLDIKGRVLRQIEKQIIGGRKSVQSMNIRELPDGIYLLRIGYKDQVYFRKILIQ